jgi:phosphonate transport system permease protein
MTTARWSVPLAGIGGLALVTASFWTLDLRLGELLAPASLAAMGRFAAEFFPPNLSPAFLSRLSAAALETLAMSVLGTVLAAALASVLCLPAVRFGSGTLARWRIPARLLFNFLRSIPELVWASLLLVAAGLGPMSGTLALALHTTGVFGRLFAETIENAPQGPAQALRVQGTRESLVLLYATLPQVTPQLLSYVLYRWENNIRAAAILGVVGAGGLGQMLAFHLGLFQMGRAASVIAAMMVLVYGVDLASYAARRMMVQARD